MRTKILVFDGKKIGSTIIIIGLMLMIIGVEQYFDDTLRTTTFLQYNLSSFKEYIGLDNKLKYKLPGEWITKQEEFYGKEIIYHNDFESKKDNIRGFVQVWNKSGELKRFLDNSKTISEKQNIVTDYSINPIMINDFEGYKIKYNMESKKHDGKYSAFEYFIENGDSFVRVSFFVNADKYKDNMETVFKTIVKTIQYN